MKSPNLSPKRLQLLVIPKPNYRLRLFAIVWGILVLGWLSIEDTTTLPVVILGTGISLLGFPLWITARFQGQRVSQWVALPLLGAVMGMGAIVSATLLMFFKTAWHSHLYPDFPTEMILAMLERVPIWTLAGAMIGLALAIMGQIATPENHPALLESDASA